MLGTCDELSKAVLLADDSAVSGATDVWEEAGVVEITSIDGVPVETAMLLDET